jgi:hypothetical protein
MGDFGPLGNGDPPRTALVKHQANEVGARFRSRQTVRHAGDPANFYPGFHSTILVNSGDWHLPADIKS